ncbi:hypothetical protein RMQ97_13885 [Maricaulis sp. D1M11]|uniref:hypothetical protein n=1 Tax=Maricaulis sp. D1M11 TaxID=3076117 RepID=UPI0039B47FEC
MTRVRETTRSDLRQIVKGGATSRILDLHSIAKRYGETEAHDAYPFFLNGRLNRSFIVKHTVRAHERSYVLSQQPVVTKIICPLAEDELELGGHVVFVEENGFVPKMRALFGRADEPHMLDLDLIRLRELAAMPSFDPFLLAERYRNHARPIADCYFSITPDEIAKMEDVVAGQIVKVVALAFGENARERDDQRALNFARLLLNQNDEAKLDQLRASLDMTTVEFKNGLFGWKGILYYRWSMAQAVANLKRFIRELQDAVIVGPTPAERQELDAMRRLIVEETRARWTNLSGVMETYENVFARFSRGQDPKGFRTFLERAPGLFYDMGSDLSVVSHVPSFWNFWKRENKKPFMEVSEARTLFTSFIASIARHTDTSGKADEILRANRAHAPIPAPPVIDTTLATGT